MSTPTAYSYRSHRSLVKRDFSHSLKIDFIVYRLITQGMGIDMEPKEKGFTRFDLESKQPCLSGIKYLDNLPMWFD